MHEGQFFCSSTLPGGYLYPLKISAGLVYILFFYTSESQHASQMARKLFSNKFCTLCFPVCFLSRMIA